MKPSNADMSPWILRLVRPHEASAPSSQMHSRIEVCPPELWPSSVGWRAAARRWMERAPWGSTDRRPANRLAEVKREFRAAAADLPDELLAGLDDRIERARSLREFWHLRSPLYNAVSLGFSQVEAERRLARLNRHFPIRAPRGTLAQAA